MDTSPEGTVDGKCQMPNDAPQIQPSLWDLENAEPHTQRRNVGLLPVIPPGSTPNPQLGTRNSGRETSSDYLRAHAFVGEDFEKDRMGHSPIDERYLLHPCLNGGHGAVDFGNHTRVDYTT